jgi:hypothetical protein
MISNIPKKELIRVLRGKLEDELLRMSYSRKIEIATRLNILNANELKEKHLTHFIIDKMVNHFIHWCQPTTNAQIVNSVRAIFEITLDPFMIDRGTGDTSKLEIMTDTLEHLKVKNLPNCHCCEFVGHKQLANKKNFIQHNTTDNVQITCTNSDCGRSFHYNCMKWPMDQLNNFECPACIIKHNDPLHDPYKILYEPSLLVSEHTYTFSLNFDDFNKIYDNQNLGIEIRCVKLDNEHFHEQTWPDKCTIKINNRIVKILKPLNQNSSLKKRRDEKFFTRNHVYPGINTLCISYENYLDNKNSKENQDCKYVFTILLIKKFSVEKLRDIVVQKRKISYDLGKQFIKERFTRQNDLQISEIKADLVCKITYSLIDTPARGIHCKHINCFSLSAYIRSMEQNSVRKWICPLCRKRCPTLLYDEYMDNVLKDAKKIASQSGIDPQFVYFDRDAEFSFNSRQVHVSQPGFSGNTSMVMQTPKASAFDSSALFGSSDGMKKGIVTKKNNEILEIDEDSSADNSGNQVASSKKKSSMVGHRNSTSFSNDLGMRAEANLLNLTAENLDKGGKDSGKFFNDNDFLGRWWKYMSDKGKVKSKTFSEFIGVFKNVYNNDANFTNCVDLLYRAVEKRKSLASENPILCRYNKIFDQLEELDWLLDDTKGFVEIRKESSASKNPPNRRLSTIRSPTTSPGIAKLILSSAKKKEKLKNKPGNQSTLDELEKLDEVKKGIVTDTVNWESELLGKRGVFPESEENMVLSGSSPSKHLNYFGSSLDINRDNVSGSHDREKSGGNLPTSNENEKMNEFQQESLSYSRSKKSSIHHLNENDLTRIHQGYGIECEQIVDDDDRVLEVQPNDPDEDYDENDDHTSLSACSQYPPQKSPRGVNSVDDDDIIMEGVDSLRGKNAVNQEDDSDAYTNNISNYDEMDKEQSGEQDDAISIS